MGWLGRRRGWPKVGGMTYVIRVLCGEVFHRWDGTLSNELPVGRGCLLLHDLGLHAGEGGKDAGKEDGHPVSSHAQGGQCASTGKASSLHTQVGADGATPCPMPRFKVIPLPS